MPFSSLKYAAAFGLLAICCLVFCLRTVSIVLLILFLVISVSFAFMAMVYVLRRPELLGKRTDGSQSLAPYLITLPFRIINSAIFSFYRLTHRGLQSHEIQSGLLLGRKLTQTEAIACNANCVVDLTTEFLECNAFRSKNYVCIPMLDGTAPSLKQLDSAVDAVKSAMDQGTTYLHCALGHGRSATVAIAYLLAKQAVASVDDGIRFLQDKRPGVKLSTGQRAVLVEYFSQKILCRKT